MKIATKIAATAASLAMLTSVAVAQMADRRDFLDPLGVWNNQGYASQQQVFSPGPPSKVGSPGVSHFHNVDMNWEGNWDRRGW